jgi:methylmalonyl-CoA mutase
MDKKVLFAEFAPITTEQWEAVIQKDLKGADYERKLIRKTLDGIPIRPYYRSENLEPLSHLTASKPNEFPFVRGAKTDNNWLIRQDIIVESFGHANCLALEAIQKGAESVLFSMKNVGEITEANLSELLSGFPIETVELNFATGRHTQKLIGLLTGYFKSNQVDVSKVKGSFTYDPLRCLTLTGSFCETGLNSETLFNKEMLTAVTKDLPGFKLFTVHASYFKNAGSTIVQELAFGLAMGCDYLASAVSTGISVNTIAPSIKFKFAAGPEYFMEIAKIRAARYLWAQIIDAFGPCCHEKAKMYIHSETASYNQTIYDPYVNMLRTTTEAMSAVIGGTDSLTVQPFNLPYDKANPFSERIARNQQILLKKESYLDKVADPSAGAYFIESLTNSIIEESWKLFLQIEEKGGYFKAFESGFIQQTISETAKRRDANIANRQEILLGTNQYPNFNEKAKETIKAESMRPGGHAACTGKIAEPVRIYRAAEAFEKLRLATENSDKTPKVFLLTYGNLAMRKARATFSTNFFACAGFEVIDNNGFATPQAGIDAAIAAKADIVVICSSDEEYPVISKEIAEGLQGKIVVVAGYPKESLELLQSFGIKYFIHMRSNVLETLKEFQNALGI